MRDAERFRRLETLRKLAREQRMAILARAQQDERAGKDQAQRAKEAYEGLKQAYDRAQGGQLDVQSWLSRIRELEESHREKERTQVVVLRLERIRRLRAQEFVKARIQEEQMRHLKERALQLEHHQADREERRFLDELSMRMVHERGDGM